ncbi:hypothetical protein [Streptomyces sp. MS191]|uniref:hypothetical protein n=1 Tax=Streptomyces sp. ms191 TaxID=1827978 RepID=UPI00164EE14D|nr:hypothetical protein [Streptomyces sp. ms191]
MTRLPPSESTERRGPHASFREPRWPMASAVLAAMVLTMLLPDGLRLAPRWVFPVVEGALLLALIAGDPGRIDRRTTFLRAVSITLVGALALSAVVSTVHLVDDLIHGGRETGSASSLLQSGGTVWVCTILAFSLLYYELDGGGSAARTVIPRPDASTASSSIVDVRRPGMTSTAPLLHDVQSRHARPAPSRSHPSIGPRGARWCRSAPPA